MTILALCLFIAIYGYVASRVDWRQFASDKFLQHLVFGSGAALFVLWLFRAGIYDGLDVHFLWLSALTLTLGFHYALLIAGLVLVGITVVGKESWDMLGANGLLGVCLPIALTYGIYAFSFHRIPRHLFVYVFVCAFFPGALMIALKMLFIGGFYVLGGVHALDIVNDNYWVLIPLLLFPEAMLNGMTMTLLIIYKPHWVKTFADRDYLDPK
jgi:uncharacterized membrane protein